MSKVHRGRPKTGTVPITIRLTPDEIEQLDALADANLRSRTGQAAWIVIDAIRKGLPHSVEEPEPAPREEPELVPGKCHECGKTGEDDPRRSPMTCWDCYVSGKWVEVEWKEGT
jgi:hypothetical protein